MTDFIARLKELRGKDWLDCGDNSCMFLMKPRTGVRTNGGCRCFKYCDIPPEKMYVIKNYHEIAKSLDRWLNLAETAEKAAKDHDLRCEDSNSTLEALDKALAKLRGKHD